MSRIQTVSLGIGLAFLALVARVEVARADFLYVANLGTQSAPAPSIDVYTVSPLALKSSLPIGQFPARGLLVVGNTLYATASSNEVLRFAIDPATGLLTPGKGVTARNDPRGMAAEGATLFVANHGTNSLGVYAINVASGALKLAQTVTGVAGADQLAIIDTSPRILVSSGTDVCTFAIGGTLKLLRCSPSSHQAGQPASSVASLGKEVYFTQYTVTGFGTLTGVGAFDVKPATGLIVPRGPSIPYGVIPLYGLAASPRDRVVYLARSVGISTLSAATATSFSEVAFLQMPAVPATLVADPKRKIVYAASPIQNQIFSIDFSSAPPTITPVAGSAGGFPLSLGLLSQ